MRDISQEVTSVEPECSALANISDEDLRRSLMSAATRVVKRRIAEEGPLRAGLLPFSWVTAEEVARIAGLSPDVFDELWDPVASTKDLPGVSAFEAFVLESLGTFEGPTIKAHTFDALDADLDDFDELIRTGAIGVPFDPNELYSYLTSMAVSAYSLKYRQDHEAYMTDVAAVLELGLTMFGRRMRSGLTFRHLALPIAAALEGVWIYTIFGVPDPNPTIRFRITPDAEERDWTLDGISAWSSINAMTELDD